VLSVLLLLLLPVKAAFYRPSRLDRVGLTPQWALVVAAILGVVVWLGLYAYAKSSIPASCGGPSTCTATRNASCAPHWCC